MFSFRSFLAVASLAALLAFTSRGNDLDDYEALFADVTKNYQEAIEAGPDSRLAADYSVKLTKLCELAEKIQRVITRLQIEEINLKADTDKLNKVFRERLESRGKGDSRSSGMEATSGRWLPTDMIKNKDIKPLRQMGFTTDGGGSYQKALQKKDGFDEFEDLLNFYDKSVLEVHDNPENNEWRQIFERKLARLKVLAANIQTKLLRELPDVAKDLNMVKEANYLDKFYDDLVAAYAKVHNEQQRDKNSSSSSSSASKKSDSNKDSVYDDTTGRKKKVTETNRIMMDVKYTVKRVRDGIVKLKGLGFSLEGKLTREAKESASAEEEPVASDSKEFSAMTENELYGALQRERDRIYKANVSMSGLSPVVQKYYLETLSSAQKTELTELTKKYLNRGYKGDQAKSSAMLELHGLLKSTEVSVPKAEMAQILKKVRASKEQFEKDLEKERFDQLNK